MFSAITEHFDAFISLITAISTFILMVITFDYSYQTRKTVIAMEKQNLLNKLPHLDFNGSLTSYSINNSSQNTAFNVYLLLKKGSNYKILKEDRVIATLPSGGNEKIEVTDLVSITPTDLQQEISAVIPLVRYLENNDEDASCVVYQDVLGNAIYSLFYASSSSRYDKCFETGYLKEL